MSLRCIKGKIEYSRTKELSRLPIFTENTIYIVAIDFRTQATSGCLARCEMPCVGYGL